MFPHGSDPEQITLPLKLFSCVGTRGSVHCSGRRSGRRHYRKQIQQLPSKELFSPQGSQASKPIDRQAGRGGAFWGNGHLPCGGRLTACGKQDPMFHFLPKPQSKSTLCTANMAHRNTCKLYANPHNTLLDTWMWPLR